MHKAIRRLTPAPRARRFHAEATTTVDSPKVPDSKILVDVAERPDGSQSIKVGSYQGDSCGFHDTAKTAIYMKRRASGTPDGRPEGQPVRIKQNLDDMRHNLRLGPANRAAKPLSNTRQNLFKIKQGSGVTSASGSGRPVPPRAASAIGVTSHERTPLLGADDLDNVAESADEGHGSPKSKSRLNGKRTLSHE